MKGLSPRALWLLVLMASNSPVFAQSEEFEIVDFEQFPLDYDTHCPSQGHTDWDHGVRFISGEIVSTTSGKMYGTHVYSPPECTNPLSIQFFESASQVSLELYTGHMQCTAQGCAPFGTYTVSDDRGWSETITTTTWNVAVALPSTGMREILIYDHDVTNFRFQIDNIRFKRFRPCLSVNGEDEVEPNDANNSDRFAKASSVVVEVTDCEGNPVDDIVVETTVAAEESSGNHILFRHTAPRPAGGLREVESDGAGTESITNTSGPNGQIQLEFVPPEASGTHIIKAKCVAVECFEPDPPLSVKVKVSGLAQIPTDSAFYTLTEYLPGMEIGKNIGDNGRHDGVNHNLTPEASRILERVAVNYAVNFDYLFVRLPEKLHVNDASLPWGGLFDYMGSWSSERGLGHNRHRRGTVVDIRANQCEGVPCPGAIPPQYGPLFDLAVGDEQGVVAIHEYVGLQKEHYHVLLRGVQE